MKQQQGISPAAEELLAKAAAKAGGTPVWQARKRAEARDLLALAEKAPWRLNVHGLDLRETLHALLLLRAPVPCREDDGQVALADRALMAIHYPQAALLVPQPGYAFVQILTPRNVFHPNVAADEVQALCLGAKLPAGIRARELALMAFGALSMQNVTLDQMDPAGVMNGEAAGWWQQNTSSIPLTRVPFLGEGES